MYLIFLSISIILALVGIIQFYPIYQDNMFPLFTDVTTFLLFLPSYFILFFSILFQIIYIILNKINKIKIAWMFGCAIYLVSVLSIYTLFYKHFQKLNLIIFFIPSIIGIIHFIISMFIYKHSYKHTYTNFD